MKKLIIVSAAIFILGCGSSQGNHRGIRTVRYCFKAKQMSKYRCYDTMTQCVSKQSIITDQHPWAKLDSECGRKIM